MTSKISPTALARSAVNAWNRLSWGFSDVAAPYNELVAEFGDDEAQNLVCLVLAADGMDDVGYAAFSLREIARKQTEEREGEE